MTPLGGTRDRLIMNTVPRFEPASDRVLLLAATAQAFKVPATGVASPAAITFTAALLNMVGTVDISTSDGSVLELDGNTATLRYAAMASNTTTILARIVVDGLTYTASQTVSKVFDGVTGNSSRVCYSKTNLSSLASAPASISTAGDKSYPPINTWGDGTVWEGSPQEFIAGESLYRSDGIFNPASGTTSWAAPYLNALKVGRLSAISADIGEITAGTLRAVTIFGGPGYLTKDYAWPTNGLGGFHLSKEGLLLGCFSTGKYFKATADGNVYMPGLKVENGQATFSGLLSGVNGNFSGTLTGRNVVAANFEANMALIGTVIRSQTYIPGSYGWMISADGTAEFSVLSITGRPTGPVYGYSNMAAASVTLASLGSATAITVAHKVLVTADGQVWSAAAAGSIITIYLYHGSTAGGEVSLLRSWSVRSVSTGSGTWEDRLLDFLETMEVPVVANTGRTGSGVYFKAVATRDGSSTSGTTASITLTTNIKNPTT